MKVTLLIIDGASPEQVQECLRAAYGEMSPEDIQGAKAVVEHHGGASRGKSSGDGEYDLSSADGMREALLKSYQMFSEKHDVAPSIKQAMFVRDMVARIAGRSDKEVAADAFASAAFGIPWRELRKSHMLAISRVLQDKDNNVRPGVDGAVKELIAEGEETGDIPETARFPF